MKHTQAPPPRSFAVCIASLSRIAQLILFIGLPYIAAHLTAVALLLRRAMDIARFHAYIVYFPQAEALICSLCILIGGAALFDILEKQKTYVG